MRSLTVRIVLCFTLALRVSAGSLSFQDIASQVQHPQEKGEVRTIVQAPVILPQDGPAPDFVRLADGRIVPFGPGILCTDECVESELVTAEGKIFSGGLRPWLIAVPIVAAGIIACVVLCHGGSSSQTVLATSTPPIIVPPQPPNADVPEPATLVLLGLGLTFIARRGFGKKTDQLK